MAEDNDDEFDDNLEDETVEECREIYLRACRLFKVTPSSYFYRCLCQTELSLQNNLVGSNGAKAIATALVKNTSVRGLNLTSTGIGITGLTYILDMLKENYSITKLNLSCNKLGSEGLQHIKDSFVRNKSVRHLNISGNDFTDQDSSSIERILKKNKTLTELLISRNAFGEMAGTNLSNALERNRSLALLDISWNHLRQCGAIEFCRGLQNNTTLKSLNLGWNGFGLEGCHELGKCLQINRSLTDLDLSSNRINYDAFKLVLRGLSKNKRIKSLKIGFNPITTDGAVAILGAVADDQCSSLVHLDMSHISVDTNFLSLLRDVKKQRPLTVIHGIVMRQFDLRKGDVPVVLDTDDPVTILFECVKTRNLRLIDLLKNLDKDNSETLSREELRRGLEEIDIPLSRRSMDILMNRLDINKDGQVDFSELSSRYKEHVRRVTKLTKEADIDLKHYKNFDRLQQIREAVKLRLRLAAEANRVAEQNNT